MLDFRTNMVKCIDSLKVLGILFMENTRIFRILFSMKESRWILELTVKANTICLWVSN